MDKKLINEDISNIKYLFGYKPGRVISEQDIDYTTEDFSQDEIDEEGRPERLVKHIDTGKLVGTYKYGRGFTPSPHGEELGFEHHPSSIPNKTKFGGTEVGDFDYEDDNEGQDMDTGEELYPSFSSDRKFMRMSKSMGDMEMEEEITEDNDDLFLRRRSSTIENLIDKHINEVEEEGTLFSDEYEFADNIISWVVQDLTTSDYSDHDYDKLTDLIKDKFGDYILSQYVESDFDNDDNF